MFKRKKIWNIHFEADYVDQIIKLDLNIQRNIEKHITELSYQKNPRDYGYTTDCGKNDEDCPYIIVIFQGLSYEFMYRMYPDQNKLLFIDCYRLDILDHGQDGD